MPKNNFFKSALSYEGKILDYYKFQQEVQNELLITIKASLPERLARHALYCVATENKILLYTDSASWSSQLRFYHSQILQKLSTSNQRRFEVLQIKIIPATLERKGKPAKIPSKENIAFILNQANSQTDEVLKSALLNLAGTLSKLSKVKTPD